MKVLDDISLEKVSGGNSGLAAASSGLTNQRGSDIAKGIVGARQNQGRGPNRGANNNNRGGNNNSGRGRNR